MKNGKGNRKAAEPKRQSLAAVLALCTATGQMTLSVQLKLGVEDWVTIARQARRCKVSIDELVESFVFNGPNGFKEPSLSLPEWAADDAIVDHQLSGHITEAELGLLPVTSPATLMRMLRRTGQVSNRN